MGLKWNKASNNQVSTADRLPGKEKDVSKFDSLNLETFTLVWLDRKLETTSDNLALLAKLRTSVNAVRTFTHLDTCRMFIEAQSVDDRLILVVSGECGQQLIPVVHDTDQINSIYIFCMNRTHHTEWARSYPKVNILLMIRCQSLRLE